MFAVILTSLSYVAAQLLDDFGSLKIITLAGYTFDGSIFIYPFTLTLRDLVHKVVGFNAVRVVIIVTAFISLYMAGYLWFISSLPGILNTSSQVNFNLLFRPVWRIVVHTLVIECASELLDTEIYHLWVKYVTFRFQWSRVLVSNIVSAPIDSIFAVLILSEVFPPKIVWSSVGGDVIAKIFATLIGMGLIYIVKDKTKDQ